MIVVHCSPSESPISLIVCEHTELRHEIVVVCTAVPNRLCDTVVKRELTNKTNHFLRTRSLLTTQNWIEPFVPGVSGKVEIL